MVAKNTPLPSHSVDRSIKVAIEKLAETLDTGTGVRGAPDEKFIRIKDLVDMGLAKKLAGRAQQLVSGVNLVGTNVPIYDIPPQPEDFAVVGGIGIIFLNWKNARQIYSNHAYAEIWRAETDNLSSAVLIQQEASSFGGTDRNATYGTTYYYWIRFVSQANISGPYNSAVGTDGKLAEDPEILLDMLQGAITESELHSALNSRIDLIDSTGGLVDQSLENATDIANEAAARLSLAQQLRGDYTGSDLTELTTGLLRQESVTRTAEIDQLSSQMALLTAGSSSQFDYAEIWYFDAGVEGWTSNGTPTTTNPGFLRAANHASDPYLLSPTDLGIDGAKYTQVRFRIKKVGSPTWQGTLQFITVADGTYEATNKINTFAEPTFDDGIAYITITFDDAYWVGETIKQLRLDLTTAQDSSNYIELDWIAVGRPSPGASSAELFTEQLARISGDSANASDIALANAAIAGKASSSALSALDSRVTTAEGTITSQSSQLTSLSSQLYPRAINKNCAFADWAGTVPDNYTNWAGSLTKVTGSQYAGGNAARYVTTGSGNFGFQADITDAPNVEFVDIEIGFVLVSGSLSGSGILFDWRTPTIYRTSIAFKDLYTAADIYGKKIVCKARVKRPSGFTGTLSSYKLHLMADYPGDGLGAIAVKEIIFDSIVASVSDASANAIQSLDTRVTSAEGSITSQSSQITQLDNSIVEQQKLKWTQDYLVNNSTVLSILYYDGAALPTSHSNTGARAEFVATGVTFGTGNVTKTIARFYYDGSNWQVEQLSSIGQNSNHPVFLISSGVPAVKTNHASFYSVRVTMEDVKLAGGHGSANSTAISALNSSVSLIDGELTAQASSLTMVSARLDNAGGTGVTVEEKITATASDVNGLYGQYTVKIDNNGIATGFGLSSETVNGQTNSYFLVDADTFGIVNSGAAKVVSSLTRSSTTATASCTGHGLTVGEKFSLSNIYDAGWNGVWTVATVPNANSFTFTVPGTLTTPATARIRINGKLSSSLTRSSTTATATFLSAHEFSVGGSIDVAGVTQAGWNGKYTIASVPTPTTLTFTVSGGLTTPATSAMKAAAQTIPFVVSGGKVVMDGAFIKSATITTAQIGNLAVTAAKIAAAAINDLQVGTLTVDTIIQQNASEDLNQISTIPVSLSGNADDALQSYVTPNTTRSRKYLASATLNLTGSGNTLVTVRGIASTGLPLTPSFNMTIPGGWAALSMANGTSDISNPTPLYLDWSSIDGSSSSYSKPTNWDSIVSGSILVIKNGSTVIGIASAAQTTYDGASSTAPGVYTHRLWIRTAWCLRLATSSVSSIDVYSPGNAPYKLIGETNFYLPLISSARSVTAQLPAMPRNSGSFNAWLACSGVGATCVSSELNIIGLR